jgi:hypothetical protein
MDAEALLDTRAKDLQALTFRLSPPGERVDRRLTGFHDELQQLVIVKLRSLGRSRVATQRQRFQLFGFSL